MEVSQDLTKVSLKQRPINQILLNSFGTYCVLMQLTHSKFYHYLKNQKYCIRIKESKTFIFSINFNIFTFKFVAQIVMNLSNQVLSQGSVK